MPGTMSKVQKKQGEITVVTSTTAPPVEFIEKDDVYYLQPVVIQVENRLFQFPCYCLERSSEMWKNAFAVLQGSIDEGSSDKNPIKLQEVKKEDFRNLLEVLLPLKIPPSFEHIPKDGWIAILRLAKMWRMHDIRETAIKRLAETQLLAVERIVLGREYCVVQWLYSGYEELVQRSSFLTDEEAEQIGCKSAMAVCRAREKVRPGYVRSYDIPDVVGDIFGVEFLAARHGSLPYLLGCR